MGGVPSGGPAVVAAYAKTTRDHAATHGRRVERPSPSPSPPLPPLVAGGLVHGLVRVRRRLGAGWPARRTGP